MGGGGADIRLASDRWREREREGERERVIIQYEACERVRCSRAIGELPMLLVDALNVLPSPWRHTLTHSHTTTRSATATRGLSCMGKGLHYLGKGRAIVPSEIDFLYLTQTHTHTQSFIHTSIAVLCGCPSSAGNEKYSSLIG